MTENIKLLKHEVDVLQQAINAMHEKSGFVAVQRTITLWAKAVRNYNKAVTEFLEDM